MKSYLVNCKFELDRGGSETFFSNIRKRARDRGLGLPTIALAPHQELISPCSRQPGCMPTDSHNSLVIPKVAYRFVESRSWKVFACVFEPREAAVLASFLPGTCESQTILFKINSSPDQTSFDRAPSN